MKDKNTVSVSGLEINHRSRFRFLFFLSPSAFSVHAFSYCPFTAIVRVWCEGSSSSPVCPSSFSFCTRTQLTPPPVYPNLAHSNLLFNQIGAQPVELSPPHSLFFSLSCMEPPGQPGVFVCVPVIVASGPKICSVTACYRLDTNKPGHMQSTYLCSKRPNLLSRRDQ